MKSILVALVFLTAALATTQARAQSLCPRGYFQADARNVFEDSRLRSQLCISIATAPTQINMRLVATAELPVTDAIESAVLRRFAGMRECAIGNAHGWTVNNLHVRLSGPSAAPRLRIDVTGKECLSRLARGLRFTYEVPLTVSFAGNRLVVRANTQNARVTSEHWRGQAFSGYIVSVLNGVTNRLDAPWDYNGAIPGYVRFMNPQVERVDVTYRSRRLVMRVHGRGSLSKAAGDQLLNAAVGSDVVPLVRRWLAISGS
jgi:hypothetical protein